MGKSLGLQAYLGIGILLGLVLFVYGGLENNGTMLLIGVGLFAGSFLLLGGLQAGEREENARYRAEVVGICDWCGGRLPNSYQYCSECAENFCSKRCFYEHRKEEHNSE